MIRDSVLAWGAVLLIIVLAFILMPTYERFKDASGKEVDVSPDAPPMPEWLKPQSGASKPVEQTPSIRPVEPTKTVTPPPPLPPSTAVPPITVSVDQKGLPPPSTNVSDIPSGVKTLPSQSMPPDKMLQSVGANTGLDKQVLGKTLPAPTFENPLEPSGISQGEDKYVLKSSLVPFACGSSCASRVPGGNDGMTPSVGGMMNDGVQKPFSAAFGNQNEPQGYLNSFAAFMK